MVAFGLLSLSLLSFTIGPPAAHSTLMSRSRVTMQDNPLAKFNPFAKKKQESALVAGMDALLKDAPLPVKMLGGLMKPLVEGLGSALAEAQDAAEELRLEAQGALRADARVASLLGSEVVIGATFSQASSNVNGAQSITLQCQLSGSGGAGVVAIRGDNSGGTIRVNQLQVQANGQQFDVPVLRGSGGGPGGSSDGVIDVDVI